MNQFVSKCKCVSKENYFKYFFLCESSCCVFGPQRLTTGLVGAAPFFCLQALKFIVVWGSRKYVCVSSVLLCMAPPSGSVWLLEKKCWVLHSVASLSSSLDVVALLWTCFQCSYVSAVQIHSFIIIVWWRTARIATAVVLGALGSDLWGAALNKSILNSNWMHFKE